MLATICTFILGTIGAYLLLASEFRTGEDMLILVSMVLGGGVASVFNYTIREFHSRKLNSYYVRMLSYISEDYFYIS
ncbi:hypothetical protein PSAL_003460 [Pseudooceanicola algae]|uniref:Uncharacterized protein n=1 Tax=Pseudooceanicola algae TaxID=1537215 RepID=A0A418SK83_9RHOB|nr:hypothetical protein PSAL_003460 [Pseudooceanicola algae]